MVWCVYLADVPHFRYTGTTQAPPPAAGIPGIGGDDSNDDAVPGSKNVAAGTGKLCPHHENAGFAAAYVANHLQQYKLPGTNRYSTHTHNKLLYMLTDSSHQ